MRKLIMLFLMIGMMAPVARALEPDAPAETLLILCYHDIPKAVKLDKYGVDRQAFVQQIEYLRTHGYHFVSLSDVIAARQGAKPLPAKAVFLTFDDAYQTFYEFVYPLLKLYEYPCLLSVVTSWIETPPERLPGPLMTWDQVKEVSQSGLVDVASHTDNLHRSVLYNSYGNTNSAAVSRLYDTSSKTYETEEAFLERIKKDLAQSREQLLIKARVVPKALVWPYGQYSAIDAEVARDQGFEVTFSLDDKLADIMTPMALPRVMIVDNPSIEDFIISLKVNFSRPERQRVVQVDLDQIYDADVAQQERNLDAFIERLATLKPTTVYLQAFCDIEGSGVIKSVYFPNRILPMKADLFNRAVNQLAIRGIQVFAWMPMLSIAFPDTEETQKLRVLMRDKKGTRLPSAAYERLSPFSQEAVRKIVMLYEDMAANARIDGVVFLDDGTLDDFEDFHPDALEAYRKITGNADVLYQDLDKDMKEAWIARKTQALDGLAAQCAAAVKRYRPLARTARTLYAPVLADPKSEEWFAQSYPESLRLYDFVVIMAYPEMEKVSRPLPWLKSLVSKAKKYPDGLARTVFKLQAYDWRHKRWIKNDVLLQRLRALVAAGARHIGYYPDNCLEDKPREKTMRLMMGSEDFPFKRKDAGAEMDPYR